VTALLSARRQRLVPAAQSWRFCREPDQVPDARRRPQAVHGAERLVPFGSETALRAHRHCTPVRLLRCGCCSGCTNCTIKCSCAVPSSQLIVTDFVEDGYEMTNVSGVRNRGVNRKIG
jgi:hypothetical protein